MHCEQGIPPTLAWPALAAVPVVTPELSEQLGSALPVRNSKLQ